MNPISSSPEGYSQPDLTAWPGLDSECQAFLLCCSDLLRDVADQHLAENQ